MQLTVSRDFIPPQTQSASPESFAVSCGGMKSCAQWVAALDAILALDVAHIIPSHGPLADKAGVQLLPTDTGV